MNLNINCYSIEDQLTDEEFIKGITFVVQIPFKVFRLLKVVDNNLYVVVDIDSLEQSYIQLSFIPADRDIKYIDNDLNSEPLLYTFLGECRLTDKPDVVFLFARVLTEKYVQKLEGV